MGKHDYSLVETTPDGYIFARLDNPELKEAFNHAQIEECRKTLGFRHDPGHYSIERQKARLRSDISSISELTPREQSHILWKWAICKRFIEMENAGLTSRSDQKMAEAIPKIIGDVSKLDCAQRTIPQTRNRHGVLKSETRAIEREPICAATLRKWLSYLESNSFDLRMLRDGRRRSGNRSRINPIMHALMLSVINGVDGALDERRPPISMIADKLEIAARELNVQRAVGGLPPLIVPCKKTISNTVKKIPKFAHYAGRHGIEAAKKKFAAVSSGNDVTRPLQRVEIDEWKVSLQALMIDAGYWERLTDKDRELVERRRPWLCVAIDVASRCILGMRLSETTTADNTMAVLKMIISDKTPFANAAEAQSPWDMMGTPELIVSDGGSALVCGRVQTAITDLMGGAAQPPAGRPNLRPYIERSFRSLATGFLPFFTGQTFANPVDRGDYESEARASLTFDELALGFVRYVVDKYHNTPHEGLAGETPRNAWLRLTKDFPVMPPPDANRCRHIFGVTISRKLGPRGVRFAGRYYQSENLQAHFRDAGAVMVDVRINEDDIRQVSVKIRTEWHTIGCGVDYHDRLSFDDILSADAYLRRRFANGAILTKEVVLDAIRDCQLMGKNAIERARIGSTIRTAEAIERAERSVMIGFSMADAETEWPPQEPEKKQELLARAIPTGGSANALPPSPPIPPKRRYKIGD